MVSNMQVKAAEVIVVQTSTSGPVHHGVELDTAAAGKSPHLLLLRKHAMIITDALGVLA